MTRTHALIAAGTALLGILGLLLWDRWGGLIWLEGAIAYCF